MRGTLAEVALVVIAIALVVLSIIAVREHVESGTVIIFENGGAWYCQASLECEELRPSPPNIRR